MMSLKTRPRALDVSALEMKLGSTGPPYYVIWFSVLSLTIPFLDIGPIAILALPFPGTYIFPSSSLSYRLV